MPPLAEPEAVSLFCVRSQLEPDEEIAELCRRLDNLPLAVELAAARTARSPRSRSSSDSRSASTCSRAAATPTPASRRCERRSSGRYELLSDDEQRLFARLSVFAGGCTLEAAEEVGDADLDTLQSLVEKSLLRFTDGRYWMLETIREYGAASARRQSGETEESMQRHVEFILKLAVAARGGVSDQVARYMARLQPNRTTSEWRSRGRESGAACRAQHDLIGRSWPFWWYRGHPAEGLRWVKSALGRSAGERTARRREGADRRRDVRLSRG